jgi:hypothetical protein
VKAGGGIGEFKKVQQRIFDKFQRTNEPTNKIDNFAIHHINQ